MKTTIEKEFQVQEPIAKVWEFVRDPFKVVECVPGAALTEKIDDKNYKGTVTSSFGPVKATYNGAITISELDPAQHKMTLNGKGLDSKGKGSADMIMISQLKEVEGGTVLIFNMEISISGMLAQFGSRLINDVSDQLLNKFIENFKHKLAGQQVDNTMKASAMMGTVLKSTMGGIFGGGEKK
jgi:carbon monoxide dehydrogenase subunit G